MSYIQNPGYVLRSTTPAEHMAIAEANDKTRDAAVAKMEEYAELLLPGAGATPWAFQTDDGAVRMTGLHVPYDATVDEVPDGLRWDTKAKGGARILVPAKKTDEGKDVVLFMDALSHTPQKLGAVSEIVRITDGTHRWLASATIEVLGDHVYATYFHPVDTRAFGSNPSDRERVEADPAWTPIPLSEFYAAREQHAPEKAGV